MTSDAEAAVDIGVDAAATPAGLEEPQITAATASSGR
jgi:hypothetical protein